MPTRTLPLVTEEIYHVVNRGVNHQPIFYDTYDYKQAIKTLSFYRVLKPPLRLSLLQRLTENEREKILEENAREKQLQTSIITFCLMPNHFHLLLKQKAENGISKFLANFQNSFTRYFNTRHKRTGHLFQGQFKAIRIETDEQLLHTSRYIHLNPYTSYVVKTIEQLKTYPWSSLREYIDKNKTNICEQDILLTFFSSRKKYLQFVLDQKDYQRQLEIIKHLILE